MRPRYRPQTTFTLAGWLLADLLLAIAMVFLVINPGARPPTQVARASPSPLLSLLPPTMMPTPSPTATPQPRGLQSEPTTFSIWVDSTQALGENGEAERARARRELAAALAPFEGQRAGIVIIQGHTWTNTPNQGNQLAALVGTLLQEPDNDFAPLFETSVQKRYHYLTNEANEVGTVDLEIYWLF